MLHGPIGAPWKDSHFLEISLFKFNVSFAWGYLQGIEHSYSKQKKFLKTIKLETAYQMHFGKGVKIQNQTWTVFKLTN